MKNERLTFKLSVNTIINTLVNIKKRGKLPDCITEDIPPDEISFDPADVTYIQSFFTSPDWEYINKFTKSAYFDTEKEEIVMYALDIYPEFLHPKFAHTESMLKEWRDYSDWIFRFSTDTLYPWESNTISENAMNNPNSNTGYIQICVKLIELTMLYQGLTLPKYTFYFK